MNRFWMVLVAVAACGQGKRTAAALQPGARVALSVSSAPQGLSATGIVAEASSATAEADAAVDDPGGVDCQNGLDPNGKECDGGPAANPTDGSPDAAEVASAGQVVVPKGMLQGTGQPGFSALGMTIVASSALPAGAAVRFLGTVDSSGRFLTTAQRASTATTGRLVGRLESVKPEIGGVSLRLLGQTVHARSDLPLALVESVEAAADKDADGVICDQNGQNEGDNTPCTPPPG
jgi:hypothetical protein